MAAGEEGDNRGGVAEAHEQLVEQLCGSGDSYESLVKGEAIRHFLREKDPSGEVRSLEDVRNKRLFSVALDEMRFSAVKAMLDDHPRAWLPEADKLAELGKEASKFRGIIVEHASGQSAPSLDPNFVKMWDTWRVFHVNINKLYSGKKSKITSWWVAAECSFLSTLLVHFLWMTAFLFKLVGLSKTANEWVQGLLFTPEQKTELRAMRDCMNACEEQVEAIGREATNEQKMRKDAAEEKDAGRSISSVDGVQGDGVTTSVMRQPVITPATTKVSGTHDGVDGEQPPAPPISADPSGNPPPPPPSSLGKVVVGAKPLSQDGNSRYAFLEELKSGKFQLRKVPPEQKKYERAF